MFCKYNINRSVLQFANYVWMQKKHKFLNAKKILVFSVDPEGELVCQQCCPLRGVANHVSGSQLVGRDSKYFVTSVEASIIRQIPTWMGYLTSPPPSEPWTRLHKIKITTQTTLNPRLHAVRINTVCADTIVFCNVNFRMLRA